MPLPLSTIGTAELLYLQQSLQSCVSGDWSPEAEQTAAAVADALGVVQVGGLSTEEMIDKTKAEASLYEFVKQAWRIVEPDVTFIEGEHLEAICLHLEAVLDGRIANLLVNIPPGCMKSLATCVFWPAWAWAAVNPSLRWMFASYDAALSIRDSLKCRQIIESDWYIQRWGDRFTLIDDQNQKTKYENSRRGWRLSTSVGGRGTGEHPDIIVVDDPHNVKQSESDAEREQALRWWDGTIASRGKVRKSRRVIIMQRLDVEDLSGHVLAKAPDEWDHVCLPMRAEPNRMKPTRIGWMDKRKPGELLWPAALNEKAVAELERDMTPRRAAGQLQQRPVPIGGAMVQREWFKLVDAVPLDAVRVRYWDKAATEDGGCFSVGVLMARTPDGRIYIEDVVRKQLSWRKRNELMLQTAQLDAIKYGNVVTQWIEKEGGSGGKESGEFSVIQLQGFSVRLDNVTGKGSKEMRARPFADQVEAGNVYVLKAKWTHAFLDEWEMFPGGKYKDQCDSTSGGFAKLVINYRPGTVSGDLTASGTKTDREEIEQLREMGITDPSDTTGLERGLAELIEGYRESDEDE